MADKRCRMVFKVPFLGQNNIYLTIVHMWDKGLGFVITEVKDPIPPEFVIDETVGDNFNSMITAPEVNIDVDSSLTTSNNLRKKLSEWEYTFIDVDRSLKNDINGSKINSRIKIEEQKYMIDLISKTKNEITEFEDMYEVFKQKRKVSKTNQNKFIQYTE